MGFMNFLKKKDSPELSFKEPVVEVPVPPSRDIEETIPEQPLSTPPETFTDHEDFMPREAQGPSGPVVVPDEAEHTAPKQSIEERAEQTRPEPGVELAEPTIPEQPVVGLDESEQAIPDEPVATPLTLPDLPELPKKMVEDSVGVTATPEEIQPEPEVEPVAPEAPHEETEEPLELETESPIIAEEPDTTTYSQETISEAPLASTESFEAPELPDSYPEDTEAEYMPEEHETEHYVDAHKFYELLLDIKAMKKNLREQDMNMRTWEDVGDRLEKKTASVLGNVDAIQENLIKIDTTLFEG